MVTHSTSRRTRFAARPFIKLWWAAGAVLALGAAWAQPAAPHGKPASRADPSDARAVTPPWVYRSSLADYRRYTDAPAIGWREANDTVTRIGGWRAYAREAQQPAAPVQVTPSTPTILAPGSAPLAVSPASAASAPTQASVPAPTETKPKSAAPADHRKH